MNLLFIGDIIGRPGRRVVKNILPSLKDEFDIDFCIANGENSAGGFGMVPKVARELFKAGIDMFTSGNHIWDKKKFVPYLQKDHRILRPANYPPLCDGIGHKIFTLQDGRKIGVINLQGRVFMLPIDCPFRVGEKIVNDMKQETDIIIIDFHAEATSEKVAMGWYLDGKVSALLGTHTHIQTADERILPKGTAYITDVGMTGGFNSIIGSKKKSVIERFIMQIPRRFQPSNKDKGFNGVCVSIDDSTGKATNIERIQRRIDITSN